VGLARKKREHVDAVPIFSSLAKLERGFPFQSSSTLAAICLKASSVSFASSRLPEDESIKAPSTTAVDLDSPAIEAVVGDENIVLILCEKGEFGCTEGYPLASGV
jgi:hypothetical protein